MVKKSCQFLSSEQPCEPKSLDGTLNIAGVEKIPSENLRFRVLNARKSTLVTVEIFVFLSSVVGDSQISLILSVGDN